METAEKIHPTLMQRFQSIFIDQLFIIGCVTFFGMLFGHTAGSIDFLKVTLYVAFFFIYEPVSIAFGCSLGNYISGIRVRKFQNEDQKLDVSHSFLRSLMKILLGIPSVATIHSDESKRALHDKAAGSVVILNKKS